MASMATLACFNSASRIQYKSRPTSFIFDKPNGSNPNDDNDNDNDYNDDYDGNDADYDYDDCDNDDDIYLHHQQDYHLI